MDNIAKKFIYGTDGSAGNYRFDISPKSVYRFLNNSDQRKKIPEYQRPYSWHDSHLLTFLDDIQRVSQLSDEQKAWFLGCIYTTKETPNDQASFVLDGQQRLTTIQLVLREFTLCEFWEPDIDWTQSNLAPIRIQLNSLITECNNCLLANDGGGNYVVRFETEPESSKVLEYYILKFKEVQKPEQLDELLKQFNALDFGTKTSKTIQNHISVIRTYLKEKYTGSTVERYSSLCNFISCLLYKFWIIEIPLKQLDYSIEIFEGLNNRGKPLTLVDKLQFKSLSIDGFNKTHIRNKWKSTFIVIEKNQVFNSEEEFFKTFFLAYRGKEQAEDEKLVGEFKDRWLVDEKTLEVFFSSVETNLRFFDCVSDPLALSNDYTNMFPKKDRNDVQAIMQILRVCLDVSKNTRQLVINLNSYSDPFKSETMYTHIIGIWNIIRFMFYKEIIEGAKSNAIRTDINKLTGLIKSEKDKSGGINYSNLFTKLLEGEFEINLDALKTDTKNIYVRYRNPISTSDFFCTKDNAVAKLVIYAFAFLEDKGSLTSWSSHQYTKEHLEHILPYSMEQSLE